VRLHKAQTKPQNNIRLTLQTTTSNMCQQNNKRTKDLLLLAGGDVAAYDTPFEFAAFANSCPSSQSSEFISSFTLPATALENKPKIIVDTSNLDEQDLELLKKQDPFLYFSIPAVHHAAVVRNSRGIDMSAIQGSRSKATSRRASCPSRIQQTSDSTKVERKSRISFECHTDLLFEELMDDFDDMIMQESS
jgi:hypothetical protein